MDAAAEAHKDVFMAVPGMIPEPKPFKPRGGVPGFAAPTPRLDGCTRRAISLPTLN